MEEHKESLASELLHEIKAQSKRWFILFIIMIILLLTTNLAWLRLWYVKTCKECDKCTETQQECDNGTNISITGSDSVVLDAKLKGKS